MRALVLDGDSTLEVQELPVPRPGHGEALVRVSSCGICHTDLHVIKGEVNFPRPAVLGHEISGTVVEIGPGGDDRFLIGDPVVGGFIMPCEQCAECERGRDDLCSTFFALNRMQGRAYDGSFRLSKSNNEPLASYSMAGLAEYCVVPLSALALRPPEVDAIAACILGCAGMTAWGALTRSADLVRGETLAVVGVGGVGAAVIQVGASLGASQIIAIDLDDAKLEYARTLGATLTINASRTDAASLVLEALGGGANVVVEAVGLAATFDESTRMLADGGRLVVVGIAPHGTRGNIEITPLVRRGHRIIGSFGGRTREDLPAVIDLARSQKFDVSRAVTERFTLDEAPEAFARLDARDIVGRAVIDFGIHSP